MRRRTIVFISAAALCAALGVCAAFLAVPKKTVPAVSTAVPDVTDTITISVAGDCTIGSDPRFSYTGSFHEMAEEKGYDYFFSGVRDVFANDTMTFVNFEGTLTAAETAAEKAYTFRGPASYTEILKKGSVEAVSLANNHSYDFLEKGFSDTKKALSDASIPYAYNKEKILFEADGVKIGVFAYAIWYDDKDVRQNIKTAVENLRKDGADLVFASFHWGIEGENVPNDTQITLGRYAIDCGADGVWGHHPHVLQGVETYKEKEIVYSLGNFCFGGNHNPRDKDAMIYQMTFKTKNGELTGEWESRILPVSISSAAERNDYRPSVLSGEEEKRVRARIDTYTNAIKGH